MKKILKVFLWINAVAMFVLGMFVNFNFFMAEDVNLIMYQKEAMALDDCGSGSSSSCTISCQPGIGLCTVSCSIHQIQIVSTGRAIISSCK
jgi:hypothetical protein